MVTWQGLVKTYRHTKVGEKRYSDMISEISHELCLVILKALQHIDVVPWTESSINGNRIFVRKPFLILVVWTVTVIFTELSVRS